MIEPVTIAPLAAEQAKMDDLMIKIRGLNQAVQNTQQYEESVWPTNTGESTFQWGSITAAQSATGATGSNATGGIHQVGHIGLSPNVYTTTINPYQNLTTTTGISGGTDYNMKVEQSGQIDIRGEKADIRINGKSMNKWMEQVEQRLNILTPNPDMEKEWDDLRRLGERYRKLEKKCQEKSRMWEALKKLPKVKV
jgi:hypothetical protein